jgi:hypothetical protein
VIVAAALLAAAPAEPSPPRVAYRIDPKHRIVEGIASDGKDLWVSSILDRVILRCDNVCAPAFIMNGPAYPFGLAWDPKRRWLWVAMQCPDMKPFAKCDGEVRAVDRKGRIQFAGRPGPGFKPGDVSVHHGVVTVSDSVNGAVYSITNKRFSTLLKSGVGKSGQGSATLAGGKTLVVADYSQGIATYALPYGARTVTARADGRPIRGIDGLVAFGNHLFGVYNGQVPGGLVALTINGPTIAYTAVEDGGLLPDPTHATVHRGALFVVGDSGWATIDKEPTRVSGAAIVRLPLPKSAN